MITWVVYDITNDKTRLRVSKKCKNEGLYRVQKSVFLGNIEKNRIDQLFLQCREIIDEDTDSLYIFPMPGDTFKQVKTAGQAFDPKLVSDEIRQLFV